MDRETTIVDLKRAEACATDAASHIEKMRVKLEASYGVTMTSIYAERSLAAQHLDRALTILRRTHDAGL